MQKVGWKEYWPRYFEYKIPRTRSLSAETDNFVLMKAHMADIFTELGRRFTRFGSDDRTRAIIRDAVAANPWFMPGEIELAAKNIASGMLSSGNLHEWFSHYPGLPARGPKNVLVIMAGNIPFVGFQDLLCVISAGHGASVKMSSKDEVLMSHTLSELLDIAPGLPVSTDTSQIPEAVIAMGGDSAVRVFRERYAGIPMLLRGSRSSIAVLDGSEAPEELNGLANDIFSYSGLGCRNVSLIFIPRNYDTGLLKKIFSARKGLNPKFRNNYLQAKALLRMNDVGFIDCDTCLMIEADDFSASVSSINYAYYDDLHEVKDWISGHDEEVQCIAGKITHSRAVAPGLTQQPALMDYPDGRDTMKFLAEI